MWIAIPASCRRLGDGRRELCVLMCFQASVPTLLCHQVSPRLAGVIKQPLPVTQCPCPSTLDVRPRPCPQCHMRLRAGIGTSLRTREGILPPAQKSLLIPNVSSSKLNLPWARRPSVSPVPAGKMLASIPIITSAPACQACP